MSKTKKHVLHNAKKKISSELISNYEKSIDELDKLIAKHDENNNNDLLETIADARTKVEATYQKVSDWQQKPRTKKKKAITWSSEYEASERPQRRVVRTEAYGDFKATSAASNRPVATWLEEGALVCKRGRQHAMIVLSIQRGSSQLLNEGTIEWHRNLSLRPFRIEE